jgi:hypothetical protein
VGDLYVGRVEVLVGGGCRGADDGRTWGTVNAGDL